MDTLLRFGSGTELYTFAPEDQVLLWDNFRNVRTRTSSLPGADGEFDEYGDSPAPPGKGIVRYDFWLIKDSAAEMSAALDAIGAMRSFRKLRLYKQPMDATRPELYCEARITSIDYSQDSKNQPHLRMRVMINFEVANPVWLAQGTESWKWGDGTVWGGGAKWGGDPVVQRVTGFSNSFSINPGGNQTTKPRVTVSIPAGKQATNIRVQRLYNGVVRDEVRYAGTLAAGDELEINTRAYSVQLNGEDAYGESFSFGSAEWFRLLGGKTNTIRVLMDGAIDQADVQIRYYEAYA